MSKHRVKMPSKQEKPKPLSAALKPTEDGDENNVIAAIVHFHEHADDASWKVITDNTCEGETTSWFINEPLLKARAADRAELKELRGWKAEALKVVSQLDTQAIAALLDLKLGSNVYAAIQPGIESLRAELTLANGTLELSQAETRRQGDRAERTEESNRMLTAMYRNDITPAMTKLDIEDSLRERAEKAEAERDAGYKALVMFAADHDEQLKQAREGRAVAQAKAEKLTAALESARDALAREHTAHRLRWNPDVPQWETAHDDAERIIQAALTPAASCADSDVVNSESVQFTPQVKALAPDVAKLGEDIA